MSEWTLKNVAYLLGGSNQSDNIGQTPIVAKYNKTFLNLETGEQRCVTDLEIKKYKRDKCLLLFYNVYVRSFCEKKLSFLTAVVKQAEYPSISKFVNTITRKLKRKGIIRLGYVWVRDIGEDNFKHYHIIIATTKMSSGIFFALFHKKKHNKYDVEPMYTKKGMLGYLEKKDLFGSRKQRTYGKSRKFPLGYVQISSKKSV